MRGSAGFRAAATLIAAVLLASCGNGEEGARDDAPAEADADLTVVARDIEFDRTAYAVDGGDVTFAYVNDGNLRHTLLIEGLAGFKLEISRGEEDTGAVQVEPGAYVLFCDVPGHRAEGMEATLTVR